VTLSEPTDRNTERQYRTAKAELRRFEAAIKAHEGTEPSPGVAPRIHEAMLDSLKSEAEKLLAQIEPA
jgi:hypothetical protein